MTSVADWVPILSTLASVAVSVVGFSGLLTAFRMASAPMDRSDFVNIRILLIFGLGAVVFSLFPMALSGLDDPSIWRWPTLILAIFLLFWPVNSPIWNRRRNIRPKRPALYFGMLAIEAALGVWLAVAAIRNVADGMTYTVGILWCLFIAMVTFVAQVFDILPVDEK